jgi:NTP pyrophosphatase (non-canonical NTP hydrolase)
MGAMGLCGEAGEVSDYLKKVLFHELPIDIEKIKKELGDTLWYLAVLSDYLGIPLSEVANANIEKLKLRYPHGFNSADAAKRADGEKNDQDHD